MKPILIECILCIGHDARHRVKKMNKTLDVPSRGSRPSKVQLLLNFITQNKIQESF